MTNCLPQFLLAPAALKETVDSALSNSGVLAAVASAFRPDLHARNIIHPVFDSCLDYASSTGWYLACNPNELDSIILLKLKGYESPIVKSEAAKVAGPLGHRFQIVYPFGVMAGDFRGLYHYPNA